MPEGKLVAALRALNEGGVEFILVGGLAAVLHGAPVYTADLDVVQSCRAVDGNSLLPMLRTSDPSLNLRDTVDGGLGYDDLLPYTTELEIAAGLYIRVLNLEKLIALKEELGAEKDRAVLPILRRTLEEKRKAK